MQSRGVLFLTKRMRNWFFIVSLAVILAAIAGFSTWYVLRPPAIPPGLVFSNGRIEATEIDIATKYSGRIEQILVREGNTVDAGQVVARLDTRELLAQLHQAQAQLQQTEDLKVADQKLADLAETQFGFATRDYDRYSQLFKQAVIGSQQIDSYQTKMETYCSAFESARSKVEADIGIIQMIVRMRFRDLPNF